MTLDRWIDALKYSVKYSGFDSIKDKLDFVELIELLEELKKRRESEQCVCDKLQTELKRCQCGSDVEVCRDDDDYYIYCPKCKLKTFSDRVYENITDNCDRLIEVWNGRVKDGREQNVRSC